MDEEKLAEMIDQRVQAALETRLKAAQPPAKKASDDAGPNEIEELRSALNREIETRKTMERKAREQAAYSGIRGALAGKVTAGAEDIIATLLQKGREQVVYGRDGSARLRIGQADYDLEEGVAEYLRTDEARMFLPPPAPQKQNAGSKPRTGPVAPIPQPAVDDPMAKTLAALAAHGIN